MTECNVNEYFVFQNLTEQILNNLKKSLNTLDKDPYYLETLCLENFSTGGVIRNAILLLSDFLVDRETHIPVLHRIIIEILDEMDLENTNWAMDSKEHLTEFTKKLVEAIVHYYSIEIVSSKTEWNIEDGLKHKKLLYADLISTRREKYSIRPYKIKKLKDFQRDLFHFLAPSLDQNEVSFDSYKPVIAFEDNTMPLFRIVEE